MRLGWYVGNQGLGIVEPVGGLFTHDFCQRLIALLTRRDESDIEFGAQRTGQSAAQADCVRPAVVGQVRDEDSHVSKLAVVRLVVAECQVDYAGRLTAHLPMARRLLLIKSDGSVSVHADDRAYKPLNWMSPPCWLTEEALSDDDEAEAVWVVTNKAGEQLRITITEIEHDSSHELGVDPGLVKDGVEAHLQELLAEHVEKLGAGYTLVRREYPTAIGPVDLLCRDSGGATVAVEIKRRGEIDGVEQLTRYLELLNRDASIAPVSGVFAAQQIKPQARTLATDRGIRCLILDYDELRGMESTEFRLF